MQSEINNIRFLSDQPIEIDKISQTKFGHEGIAETIKDIIISCPTRFTIGLFGKWGAGKTTIINIVKNKLQNEKIAVVEFDVWKHEGDALKESMYLPNSKRRGVAREIIKWLRSLDSINYRYQHSLKSVLLNWDILQPVPKEEYIDIIFERLIKDSLDINDIKLEMEILQEINPAYTAYSKYFDDILERLRNKPNIEIKREMKQGLLKIKPIAPDKSEEPFWDDFMEVEI